MDQTRTVIKGMLTENTGQHFLDSGGAYGRNWERNQGKDFEDQPEAEWDDFGGVTINLYPWLVNRLDYEEDLTKEFLDWVWELPYNTDTPWLALEEEWVASRPGVRDVMTINTYNGEDALSQVIQYVRWHDDEFGYECYLLQIHGGCDVRGGYTAPKIFSAKSSYDEFVLFDNAKVGAHCDNGHHYETDNGGYRWMVNEDDALVDEVEIEGGKCPRCGGDLEVWTTI